MNKDIKEFLKYACVIISASAVTQTADYYLKIDFTQRYAWIVALLFAFFLYLLSK